jgi:predicted HicB family RNase H-like nuclease
MKKISIPITDELHRLITDAAQSDKRSMAGWIKITLESAARRQKSKGP